MLNRIGALIVAVIATLSGFICMAMIDSAGTVADSNSQQKQPIYDYLEHTKKLAPPLDHVKRIYSIYSYVDGYAGSYNSEDGFILMMTDANDPLSQGLRDLATKNNISIRKAQFSYNELRTLQDIVDNLRPNWEIGTTGINIMENRLQVEIVGLDKAKEAAFCTEVTNSPAVFLIGISEFLSMPELSL